MTEELIQAKSLRAHRQFVGHSAESVTAMVVLVDSAGGFDDFVKDHADYSLMVEPHLSYARDSYYNDRMRATLRMIRLTADSEGIVSSEPWGPSTA